MVAVDHARRHTDQAASQENHLAKVMQCVAVQPLPAGSRVRIEPVWLALVPFELAVATARTRPDRLLPVRQQPAKTAD